MGETPSQVCLSGPVELSSATDDHGWCHGPFLRPPPFDITSLSCTQWLQVARYARPVLASNAFSLSVRNIPCNLSLRRPSRVDVDRRRMALSWMSRRLGPELSNDEAFDWSVHRRQASGNVEELSETPRLLLFVKNGNVVSKRCKIVRSRTDSPTVISSRMLNSSSPELGLLLGSDQQPPPSHAMVKGGASTSRTTGRRQATGCIVSGCNLGHRKIWG